MTSLLAAAVLACLALLVSDLRLIAEHTNGAPASIRITSAQAEGLCHLPAK